VSPSIHSYVCENGSAPEKLNKIVKEEITTPGTIWKMPVLLQCPSEFYNPFAIPYLPESIIV